MVHLNFQINDENGLFSGSSVATNSLLKMSFTNLLMSVDEDLCVTMIPSSYRNKKVVWISDMEQKMLDFLHEQVWLDRKGDVGFEKKRGLPSKGDSTKR